MLRDEWSLMEVAGLSERDWVGWKGSVRPCVMVEQVQTNPVLVQFYRGLFIIAN